LVWFNFVLFLFLFLFCFVVLLPVMHRCVSTLKPLANDETKAFLISCLTLFFFFFSAYNREKRTTDRSTRSENKRAKERKSESKGRAERREERKERARTKNPTLTVVSTFSKSRWKFFLNFLEFFHKRGSLCQRNKGVMLDQEVLTKEGKCTFLNNGFVLFFKPSWIRRRSDEGFIKEKSWEMGDETGVRKGKHEKRKRRGQKPFRKDLSVL